MITQNELTKLTAIVSANRRRYVDSSDRAEFTITFTVEKVDELLQEIDQLTMQNHARRSKTRTAQWHDGRKTGVKFAVAWLHRRAEKLNDPSAKAAMNVAANDLGREGKHGIYNDEPQHS